MIYTIGTSDRSLANFVDELSRRNIRHLVDVRSRPFSRLAHFCAPQIQRWSEHASIYYRQAGEVLGGSSTVALTEPIYLNELDRIVEASLREPVAIFCAEGDPRECHRSYEVAATLLVRFGIEAVNIRRDGSDQTVTNTLALTKPVLIPEAIRREVGERVLSSQTELPF